MFRTIPVPDSTRIGSLMARELWSPIAREDSQLFPRCGCEAATAEYGRQGIDRTGHEVETFSAGDAALNDKLVARQPFAADDLAQVVRKMFQRREAARFGVKVFEVKTPAALLAATMFAHEPVQDRKSVV